MGLETLTVVLVGAAPDAQQLAELRRLASASGALLHTDYPVHRADAVVLLPGWAECPRAIASVRTAEVLSIPVHPLIRMN